MEQKGKTESQSCATYIRDDSTHGALCLGSVVFLVRRLRQRRPRLVLGHPRRPLRKAARVALRAEAVDDFLPGYTADALILREDYSFSRATRQY